MFGNLSEGYPFSAKWLPRDDHAVVLRPAFCISRLKIHRQKTKNGMRKFKGMLSFLFVEEGKLFIKKSSFEEFNLVFFTAERMICFEMQPRQRNFLLNFQVHFALYGRENYVFEREFMYLEIFHRRFMHFFFGAKEKLQNAPRFEMDFVLNLDMWSADFTRMNGSTIRIVLRELL